MGSSSRKKRSRERLLSLIAVASVCALVVVAFVAVALVSQAQRGAELDSIAQEILAAQPSSQTAPPASESPTAAQQVALQRPEGRDLSVLYVGDSLTAGLFATTEADSFRRVMSRELGGVDEHVGARSHADAGTVGELASVPDVLDLAIVELGTNDITRTPQAEFRTTYDALLAKITDAHRDVPLVCAGVWGSKGGQGKPFDAIIEELCTEHGGVFVPLAPIFDGSGNRGPEGVDTWGGESDTFHPNDAGHQEIADELLAAIAVQG